MFEAFFEALFGIIEAIFSALGALLDIVTPILDIFSFDTGQSKKTEKHKDEEDEHPESQ
jgi:hypothetical protein